MTLKLKVGNSYSEKRWKKKCSCWMCRNELTCQSTSTFHRGFPSQFITIKSTKDSSTPFRKTKLVILMILTTRTFFNNKQISQALIYSRRCSLTQSSRRYGSQPRLNGRINSSISRNTKIKMTFCSALAAYKSSIMKFRIWRRSKVWICEGVSQVRTNSIRQRQWTPHSSVIKELGITRCCKNQVGEQEGI